MFKLLIWFYMCLGLKDVKVGFEEKLQSLPEFSMLNLGYVNCL